MAWSPNAGACGSCARQGATYLSTTRSAPRPEVPQAQRKLSFKEKHALETLPVTMKKLENEIGTLAPIETLTSETQVANAEQALLNAQIQFVTAQKLGRNFRTRRLLAR